jgi:hypothetical protein
MRESMPASEWICGASGMGRGCPDGRRHWVNPGGKREMAVVFGGCCDREACRNTQGPLITRHCLASESCLFAQVLPAGGDLLAGRYLPVAQGLLVFEELPVAPNRGSERIWFEAIRWTGVKDGDGVNGVDPTVSGGQRANERRSPQIRSILNPPTREFPLSREAPDHRQLPKQRPSRACLLDSGVPAPIGTSPANSRCPACPLARRHGLLHAIPLHRFQIRNARHCRNAPVHLQNRRATRTGRLCRKSARGGVTTI